MGFRGLGFRGFGVSGFRGLGVRVEGSGLFKKEQLQFTGRVLLGVVQLLPGKADLPGAVEPWEKGLGFRALGLGFRV